MRYLDPKADLTFKKIFGEHKDLLTEIDEHTKVVPKELLDNPETLKALNTVEESAMTKDELLAYDDFWDKLGAERLLLVDSNKRSMEEGRAEGRVEGRAEGRAEVARNLLRMGMSIEDISKATGITKEEIERL